MLGTILGSRYQIIHYLGGGGFGQTYLAEDLHLPGKPHCVVKQFHPTIENDPEALQAARRLFDTEASALYTLGDHEQIPRLFAHFEENQEFYLVQELIEGDVLSQEVRHEKPIAEAEVIQLLHGVLTVLEFVHGQQVIHRDIKPSNLIRRRGDRRIVLIDFGAVKQIGFPSLQQVEGSNMTITVGSMGYMPSEQLAGKPRLSSDIYAVGILGIQCLTGMNPKQLPEDTYSGEILWRDRAQVSPALADILDTMVRYDFRQRYPSAKEALEALRPLADVAPVIALLTTPATQSESTSGNYPTWVERGDELFQLQRFREAVSAYDKAIQAKSDEYLAWFKRGIALDHLQCYEDAANSYDQVVQLQADDYFAWFKRGNAFEKLERYAEALESYNHVVQLQPDNYWAWHDRGKTLESLQKNEDAVESYAHAVKIKPDFQLAVESRKRVLIQLKKVDSLYHLQHYDDALVACDRAIAENPDDPLAWLMRGMALEHQERHEEALAAYQRVVEIQPDDHVAWFKQGGILEQLNRYELALAAYHRVVQVQPENYWAWHDRGKILERLGRYEDAIACYDRAVQIKPDFESAIGSRTRMLTHPTRNRSLSQSENNDQTISSLPPDGVVEVSSPPSSPSAKSVEPPSVNPTSTAHPSAPPPKLSNPNETYLIAAPQQNNPTQTAEQTQIVVQLPPAPDAELSLGTSLSHQPEQNGQTAQPSTAIPQPPNPDPVESWHLWVEKGRSLEKLQRKADALIAYSHATDLNPNDPQLWQRRANLLYLMEHYPDAIASYDRAIQLDSDNAELWHCWSNCLVHLKRYKEALVGFDRAIKIDPTRPTPWYWRGRILALLKKYSEAFKSLERAIALNPDFKPAQDEYAKLKTKAPSS
jgi:tetratricopeptide (TPR) repeat protein